MHPYDEFAFLAMERQATFASLHAWMHARKLRGGTAAAIMSACDEQRRRRS